MINTKYPKDDQIKIDGLVKYLSNDGKKITLSEFAESVINIADFSKANLGGYNLGDVAGVLEDMSFLGSDEGFLPGSRESNKELDTKLKPCQYLLRKTSYNRAIATFVYGESNKNIGIRIIKSIILRQYVIPQLDELDGYSIKDALEIIKEHTECGASLSPYK